MYRKKNSSFIQSEILATFDPALALSNFKVTARHFDRSPARCNPTAPQSNKQQCSILADIFDAEHKANDLDTEIWDYLKESNEPQNTVVLDYWRKKTLVYPSLSAMARCYLSIPATSSPCKRVFSRSKSVIGPQRGSVQPKTIEHLLCLKDWYQKIRTLDPTTYEIEDLEAHDAS
jgi:hypothetical protein